MASSDTAVADLLSGSIREKLPSFKFQKLNDKILGTVMRRSVVESAKLNGSGEKQQNLVLEIETDDEITQTQADGSVVTGKNWAVWFKSPSQMLTALATELKSKGADTSAPHPGDRIAVEHFDVAAPSKVGHNPQKLYRVQYKAAAPALVNDASDLL